MPLGRELRKAREAAGLIQEELALHAHVDRSYLSELERDLKSPTVKLLLRLCKTIGVSASGLIAKVGRDGRRKSSS